MGSSNSAIAEHIFAPDIAYRHYLIV
jgi:hypothetical protein